MCAFVFAGHETSAHAMASFLYRMAKNPDVYSKLKQEISEKITEGNKYRFANILDILTFDKLNELEYLNGVAKEVLRVDNPAPLSLFYRAYKDVKIAGVDIPAGTLMA